MQNDKPQIVSINISTSKKVLNTKGKALFSGIFKNPIEGEIYLGHLGLEGDKVADNKNHGGPDKAVCAYCVDHFPFWENRINRKLKAGAFGENLSISGLTEAGIHIGDQFKIGDAIIECSQPRQPCHKLNNKFAINDMVSHMQNSGFSGYYFRVIQPGWVESNMEMSLLKEGSLKVSVESANQLMHRDKLNYKKMEVLIKNTV